MMKVRVLVVDIDESQHFEEMELPEDWFPEK